MGVPLSGVVRVQAGKVGKFKKNDKTGEESPLKEEEWKYPCYVQFMGGQLYMTALPHVHEAITRATPAGQRDGVDMMATVEIGKFREDVMFKIVSAEVPGGVNPGSEPRRPRV